MDFFKSVFAAEPTSPQQQESPSKSSHSPPDVDQQGSDETEGSGGGGGGGSRWTGLIKTFATRSESVIQTYRRDLEEFGSGLKKETEAFREAAARAVLDLPGSLEAGASVAQESLESVGQVIDDFGGSVWRETTEIISQSKEAILAMEAEGGGADQYPSDHGQHSETPSSRRYSRFEVQVLAIQSDINTFSVEPEDAQDFNDWRLGFDLAEKEDEIEKLCYDNGALEEFLEKLVPRLVDYETFWCRYYYRVHKLKQAEDARAKLVKRVISAEEEEDLSWEVDDDDDEGENEEVKKDDKKGTLTEDKGKEVEEEKMDETEKVDQKDHMNDKPIGVEKQAEISEVENLEGSAKKNDEGVTSDAGKTDETEKKVQKEAMKSEPDEGEKQAEVSQVDNSDASTTKIDKAMTSNAEKAENPEFSSGGVNKKSDDKIEQGGKTDAIGSSKDSKSSAVSNQPSVQEEEDFEWDEIEDLGEHKDKIPGDTSVNPLREDLRKKLSAVEDDEDLSWDIEDDDEPTNP
ncbi:BSD domain-containing protein 1-like [Canna indica]|uniref:BSD domain-containing protein 1-like n=1 Tax=Canna indica TaxID=4628 RepID=A0AAQ3Q6E1_9LILI|nr:BSD domain-containing protein 1-like [Canna indica]